MVPVAVLISGRGSNMAALLEAAAGPGCTVHLVTDVMDDGPILAQAAVPVLPGDDADSLAARVLAQEHRLYPLALRLHAEGRAGCYDAAASLLSPLPGPAVGT